MRYFPQLAGGLILQVLVGVIVTITGCCGVGLGVRVGAMVPGKTVSSMTGNGRVGSTVGMLRAMPSVIATRIAPRMMTVEAIADNKPSETSFRLFMKR